jgi:hypothetical protein
MLWTVLLFACHSDAADDSAASSEIPAADCAGAEAPQSIEEASALLSALQTRVGTVDSACVVRSLARPLVVVANSSVTSAQPARGEARPRLFLQSGPLAISLVPEGPGAEVIEFGEQSDPLRTRKGELLMPITAPVPVDAPFERVAHPDYGTTCAVCHLHQEPHPVRGMVSAGIRPDTWTDVPLTELAAEAEHCEGEGCDLLEAIFEDEVVPGAFPAEWATVRELGR